MARRDALLRLHKSLMARRDELRKRLGGEIKDLRNQMNADASGDSADLAFDTGSEEVASHLAELESRELAQIEKALHKLRQGTYGLCEGCEKRIPIARLNAQPYSTTCIQCQREMELTGSYGNRRTGGNWEKVSDAEAPLEDQRDIDLTDLEMDLSGNR
jgi:DnaK suppressor protein